MTAADIPCDLLEMVTTLLGSAEKAERWFNAENPLLGDVSPMNMLRWKREARLRCFIYSAHDVSELNKAEGVL